MESRVVSKLCLAIFAVKMYLCVTHITEKLEEPDYIFASSSNKR